MGKGIVGYIKSRFSKSKKSKTKMEDMTTAKANSWFLSPCNYPKTLSFNDHRWQANTQSNQKDYSTVNDAALSGTDNFIFENFNAICVQGNENENETSIGEEENDADDKEDEGWSSGSPEYTTDDLPRNLRSSHRFFAGPVLSNSLMEEARLSVSSAAQVASNCRMVVAVDSVAEITYSNDPYEDFRQSMVDMVKARHGDDPSEPLDWDFVEQLLVCYLKLNDREVHKYILGAFGDLTEMTRHKLRVD